MKKEITALTSIIALMIVMFALLAPINVSAQGVKLMKGDKAPELEYNNPEGKPIKLSSLKGQIVLIDFWASWCFPCRRANPNLVKLYNKFKDEKFLGGEKGFTIYSVSLDRAGGKSRWVNAIKKDGLTWDSHVSDLKSWNSEAAAKYGVRAIPQNYLIDGKGTIIGKFRHPADIDYELTRRLKKKKG